MHRRISICLLALIASSGCGSESRTESSGTSEATEVVIVGTRHFITDMPDGFTPGHLRALLTKIEPDLIGIEAATNVADPLSTSPYECVHVTQPWAKANNVAVVPVGWNMPEYQDEIAQLVKQVREAGRGEELLMLEKSLQREATSASLTCKAMNGRAYNQMWREYHGKLHQLAGGETPWETWNAKIVDNIRQVCQDNKGRRIAIVFGAAHSYYLADHLKDIANVRVIDTDSFLPVTAAAVLENTEKSDYLKAMRPLNLPSVSPAQLAQTGRLLDHIKGVPSLADDYQLFYGKWLMHGGDVNGAVEAFDRVAGNAGDSISRFDGSSRLIDGSRISAALALNKAGQNASARERLNVILADASSNQQVRQYAQQLLSAIPE